MTTIKPRHTRLLITVAASALVALVAAAAVIGVVRTREGTTAQTEHRALVAGSAAQPATDSGTYGAAVGGNAAGKALPDLEPSARPSASSSGTSSESGGGASISADLPPAPNGQYLVRIGSMTLQVPKGRLDESVRRVVTLTRLYDGYVLSSYAGTSDAQPLPAGSSGTYKTEGTTGVPERSGVSAGSPYADLTIRVPSERFDQAVAQIQQLGTVKALTTSTDDVTGEVVDLRARLRHYRAVEARLLTFLDKATTVGSALAVQNRIDQTQLRIEELAAELKQLSETVTYSTLSVAISEKGHPVTAVTGGGRGFWGTIRHSFALMADGFGAIFTAFGAALPFLLLIAAVVVVIWLVVRAVARRRHAGEPAAGTEGP